MRVLGIDTSGYANAIGIIDGDRILADFTFEARTDALQKIVANIDFALKDAGLTLNDIQGLGVGLGPGSWTGIRVGVTVGKILAYGSDKPVCGVPTLEAMAYNTGNTAGQICPIINAGARDTVYAAVYRRENGIVGRVGDYYVGDIPGLAAMLTVPTVIIGPEAKSYSRLINQVLDSSSISVEAREDMPKGSSVARLAAKRLERGESDDVLSLAPLYLKESTARAFMGRISKIPQVKDQD